MYLVGANICFACDHGPNRKHVEHRDRILPICNIIWTSKKKEYLGWVIVHRSLLTVYIMAKGTGSPRNNSINRNTLPIDIQNPINIQAKQPIIRSCHEREGHNEQTFSSISSYHSFSRSGAK